MLTVSELGWFLSVGQCPEVVPRVKPLCERDELLTVDGLMAAINEEETCRSDGSCFLSVIGPFAGSLWHKTKVSSHLLLGMEASHLPGSAGARHGPTFPLTSVAHTESVSPSSSSFQAVDLQPGIPFSSPHPQGSITAAVLVCGIFHSFVYLVNICLL